MPRLYSYCIPGDDGAAPNPYWGLCTLNICKPVIRRTARVGDWVVATGSKKFGFENKVVYAMEITQTMTMEDYEIFCKNKIPGKIPKWESKIYKENVGDCIYEFSNNPITIRDSVHDIGNRNTDLGGKFTLLSDNFYYFGDNPEQLPDNLLSIVKQGQGHRSQSNDQYFKLFVDWITSMSKAKNKVYSNPKSESEFKDIENCRNICSRRDKLSDEKDEEIGEE